MISWRYHLVSIVAIFLALALGVLAGTAVINQSLVANLKNTTENLNRQVQDVTKTNGDLARQIRFFTTYSDAAMKAIVNQRLAGVDVVLVTDEGADPTAVSEAKNALNLAGANLVTTLVPLPKLTSSDPADTKTLENLIAAPTQTNATQLPALTAQALAVRLAQGPPTPLHPGQKDLLESLLTGGFIDSLNPGVKVAADLRVPGAVVVVGGASEGASTPPADFLVPLVDGLSAQGVVVAAGEAHAAPDGFVALVRGASAGAGPRVTVDDLESSMGGTALVVALRRALDQRVGGDYGTDSDQLVPPLS